MCGRFHVTLDYEALKELYAVQAGLTFESYNLAPSQLAPVVLPAGNQRSVALQRFGFIPFYAKDAKEGFKSINARVETVTEKPAFRSAIQERRCIIPTSGFYEWADGKVKQPFYYSAPDGKPLSFGGIWSTKRVAGVEVDSFAILTTMPHPVVSKIHDRSPLMLSADGVNRWLDPGQLAASVRKFTVRAWAGIKAAEPWHLAPRPVEGIGAVRDGAGAWQRPAWPPAPIMSEM